jgi:pimeloyl-ACP methyl ester carboxylesterase
LGLSDGIHIAYRVFGDGPRDMVLIPGTLSHVEAFWEFAAEEYLLKRLTSFARVIVFDKRAQGLSDQVVGEQPSTRERIAAISGRVNVTARYRTLPHTKRPRFYGRWRSPETGRSLESLTFRPRCKQ